MTTTISTVRSRWLRGWAAGGAAMVALVVSVLTGCSNDAPAGAAALRCPTPATAPMTVVIGARANSTVPTLPDGLATLLTEVAAAELPITLIRLDGKPQSVFRDNLTYTKKTGPARDEELAAFLSSVRAAFTGPALAQAPEADVLAALSEASRATPAGGTIVMLDSGLQTTAPLDFRRDDLLLAEPVDIVEYLQRSELLPDLAGRSLVLVGLGNTAEPQPVLDGRLRRNLLDIWRAIGEAGRACVDVVETSDPPVSVPDAPPVGLVPPPPPPPRPTTCGDTVLGEQNNVGFRPDTTVFRDESAARAEIGKIADVARDGRQRIELIGTSARHGSRDGQIDLSQRRADRVRDILIEAGIATDRITTRGVGSYSEFYIPDGGPDNLDPGPASQNRRVIARLSCDT